MEPGYFPSELIIAIISMAVTAGIAYYGIHKANENTNLVIQYAHAPNIIPFMGQSNTSNGKDIHLKNSGNGVANNIECTVTIEKSKSGQTGGQIYRAIMTGDKDSHNLGIELNEELEFTVKAVYHDLINQKYDTIEKYHYIHEPKSEWRRTFHEKTITKEKIKSK